MNLYTNTKKGNKNDRNYRCKNNFNRKQRNKS